MSDIKITKESGVKVSTGNETQATPVKKLVVTVGIATEKSNG